MSSDLERFLQQAAERLAQKANSGGRGAGGNRPGGAPNRSQRPSPTGSPAANQPRRPPMAEIIDAQAIDSAEIRDRLAREAGDDPLSEIDTRPPLAQSISQSNTRMGDHVHQVFDHELTKIRTASPTLAQSGKIDQSGQATEVMARRAYTSPLVDTLRDPDTLRAAFIVGEIFRRKT